MFINQWKYPAKGDWTNQVKQDLNDFKIDLSLEEIKLKSKNVFKRLVKIKTKEYTLEYLLRLKTKHKKMENVKYSELKIQNYLKSSKITTEEAKNLYRFRTRAAKFKENLKSSYAATGCPLCFVHPDTQEHSLNCTVVQEEVTIKGKYKDIFEEDIPTNISKTLLEISKLRQNVL